MNVLGTCPKACRRGPDPRTSYLRPEVLCQTLVPAVTLAIALCPLHGVAVRFAEANGRASGGGRSLPAGGPGIWSKLAGAPCDRIGREMPPGMGGAWCYVPELKGFLLYGGCSPRYTNEGWLFTPSDRTWRLLWPDDSLGYDKQKKTWYVKRPREIVWSTDRPGPAKDRGLVYDPVKRLVYLFGGHPHRREGWFGKTRLGTWALDPRTLRFRYISSDGPEGMTRGVYDKAAKRIVAVPQRSQQPDRLPVTWVFDPATEKWEARRCVPSPRPGPHPAFSFDERIGQCVYFSEYGETWTYETARNRWTRRRPAVSPPPRRHAGMCFDPHLGMSILHGGVHHLTDGRKPWSRQSYDAFRPWKKGAGVQYGDTWAYDAVRDTWTRQEPEHAPPTTASARGCFAYDPDGRAAVLYDPAVGVWSYSAGKVDPASEAPGSKRVTGKAAIDFDKVPGRSAALSHRARRWQDRIKRLQDDSWLDTGLKKPVQGCLNFVYDPANRCLVWLGGCNGAVFATYEDYAYTNQVILLDMDVGVWFQRRANHIWGPSAAEFTQYRPANGCGRAFCYDATRKVIWTLGGVTSIRFLGTTGVQTYDVAADRFSRAGPGIRRYGANCGLVHVPAGDVLVGVAGQYGDICATEILDITQGRWRRGTPHPPKFSLYTRVVFDPKIGVILITMLPSDWKIGDPNPPPPRQIGPHYAMRTFTYDVEADVWKDLQPENEESVTVSDLPGIAYDSRNRVVVLVENPSAETAYNAPRRRRRVWILDLDTNTWLAGTPTPAMQAINKCSLVYDPNHNVVICGERNRIFLYRYRGGCPEDAFTDDSPDYRTAPAPDGRLPPTAFGRWGGG